MVQKRPDPADDRAEFVDVGMKQVCPFCSGDGGSYEYCGNDYAAMWLVCEECNGTGFVLEDAVV